MAEGSKKFGVWSLAVSGRWVSVMGKLGSWQKINIIKQQYSEIRIMDNALLKAVIDRIKERKDCDCG